MEFRGRGFFQLNDIDLADVRILAAGETDGAETARVTKRGLELSQRAGGNQCRGKQQ